ncbi:MAG: helix-turn-helix transcriptional regulator [Clostridia bacterium]|nr:helix-turn-helix transcriptional regulator [Clostridia bacterium]
MQAFDEGRKRINDLPLAVQCLLMSGAEPQNRWPRLHYHEYIELLYPVKGDYEVNLNGEVYQLPENSMFIINAGEPHATFAKSHDRALFCIKFLPQVLYSSEQTVTEMEYSVPYVFENLGRERVFFKEFLSETFIPKSFDSIMQEHEQKRFGYELAIRSEVLRIFSFVIRYWYESGGEAELQINAETAAVISKARRYVDEHFAEADLSSAAKVCSLSYSHFSRVFNGAMKMSFPDYVNLIRVNRSMQLLSTTEQSITDIALLCGFSSTSYYIHVFKKYKNISPNNFRRMLR